MTDIISLCIFGFSNTENMLADASIKLTQRRNPRLEKVESNAAHSADVLLIDGNSPIGSNLESQPWFESKLIIRVDSDPSEFAHSHIKRPVEWRNLPYIIELAKEKKNSQQYTTEMPSITESVLATQTRTNKILVVDDSQMIRQHLSEIIKKKGYGVSAVSSVSDALALFKTTSFDCVLMDVTMPDVDGYQGCKQIKKLNHSQGDVPVIHNPDIPVVMLTSKSSAFDKIKGKLAGCDAYITKPTTIEKLFKTIETVLR